MRTTRIRSDTHGVYIRTNGNVYRPYETKHSYPTAETLRRADGETVFQKGDEVRVGMIPQSPMARIVTSTNKEIWHSHGCYINRKSDACWMPK